jgi:hypothetical protein
MLVDILSYPERVGVSLVRKKSKNVSFVVHFSGIHLCRSGLRHFSQNYYKSSLRKFVVGGTKPLVRLNKMNTMVYVVRTVYDRTTSKMRDLSPKIISGDSRRSENAQTHTKAYKTKYKIQVKVITD